MRIIDFEIANFEADSESKIATTSLGASGGSGPITRAKCSLKLSLFTKYTNFPFSAALV